tara:strand:- start:1084 stop:1245 length:162 start_codon:yes stop_codon:yes gene_type:complete
MSKRKKKPGKQFKTKWVTGHRARAKLDHRPALRFEAKEQNVVIPYKSFFFDNE